MRTEFKMTASNNFPGIEVNLIGCRCRRKILIDLIICVNNLLSIQGKDGIDIHTVVTDKSIVKEETLVNVLKELDVNIYNSYIKCMIGEPGYYFNKDKGYYNSINTRFTDIVEKDKYSSIWYIDNPVCIADIEDSIGNKIYIDSVGEARYILTFINSDEKIELRSTEDFQYYFNNDSEVMAALNDAHPEYSLEIESNNWFEISIKDMYDNPITSEASDSDDIRSVILEGFKLFMTQM